MTRMTAVFKTLGTEPGLDFFPETVWYDPALSEELLTEAERIEREARAVREQETRDDLERERQGVNGNRINRFTKEGDETAMMQRGASARMMDVAASSVSSQLQSPHSYNINGQQFDLTDDERDFALQRAELYARERLRRAQQSGNSEEIERAQRALEGLLVAGEADSPEAFQAAMDEYEGSADIFGFVLENDPNYLEFSENSAEISRRYENGEITTEERNAEFDNIRENADANDLSTIPENVDRYSAAFEGDNVTANSGPFGAQPQTLGPFGLG